MRKILKKSLVTFLILFLFSLLAYREEGEPRAIAASLTVHPSSCLGGWEGANNATGQPDTQTGRDDFSYSNSAVLSQTASQIFCGYFQAEDKSQQPSRVFLEFSWKIDFKSNPQVNISNTITDEELWSATISSGVSSGLTSSTTPSSSKEDAKTDNSPVLDAPISQDQSAPQSADPFPAPTSVPEKTPAPPAIPEPAPAPVPAPVSEPGSPSVFRNWIIKKAMAQSDPSSANFLMVSYSIDGRTWHGLAGVSEKNWRSLAIEIPVRSWEEIDRLQIQISPVLGADPIVVYLDGLLLGIDYEKSIKDSLASGVGSVLDSFSGAGRMLNGAMDLVANKLTDAMSSVMDYNTIDIVPVDATPVRTSQQRAEPPKPKFSFKTRSVLPIGFDQAPAWLTGSAAKEYQENIKRNNLSDAARVEDGTDEHAFRVEGRCGADYFTILIFAGKDDYLKDPSTALYNKAFRCQGADFSQVITDQELPPGTKDGTYYVITADQDKKGPWRPHGNIQMIDLKRNTPAWPEPEL